MPAPKVEIICGDSLEELRKLPSESVQCCVTSPPYWGLRDYGMPGQIGLETTPDQYIDRLVSVFQEVRRVLANNGTLWLNLGDTYAGSGKGPSNSKQRPHSCLNNRQLLKGAAPKEWIPVNGSRGSKIGSVHGESGHTSGVTPPLGLKAKDLVGVPWRVALALRDAGWWLRSDIVWNKPACMPESVTDRPTRSHEYIFLLAKSEVYHYDAESIAEPLAASTRRDSRLHDPLYKTGRPERGFPGAANGSSGLLKRNADRKDEGAPMRSGGTGAEVRNKRTVWTISSLPFADAHFATYPPDLIRPCILAGCMGGGTVLDPFAGSGTTGMVALELGRNAILIELNPKYVDLIKQRCSTTVGLGI